MRAYYEKLYRLVSAYEALGTHEKLLLTQVRKRTMVEEMQEAASNRGFAAALNALRASSTSGRDSLLATDVGGSKTLPAVTPDGSRPGARGMMEEDSSPRHVHVMPSTAHVPDDSVESPGAHADGDSSPISVAHAPGVASDVEHVLMSRRKPKRMPQREPDVWVRPKTADKARVELSSNVAADTAARRMMGFQQ